MVEGQTIVTIALLIILIVPVALYFVGMITLNIAQYDAEKCDFPQGVCDIGQKVGFPQGFLRTDKFLFYAIIPLLGVWLIIYGFLDRIKIFKGSISGAIALVMAFSTVPMGLFVIIVAAMFSAMGIYSVVAFAVLFFVGIFFYARSKLFGYGSEFGVYDERIKGLKDSISAEKQKAKDLENRIKKISDFAKKQGNIGGEALIRVTDQIKALELKRIETKKLIKILEANEKTVKKEKKEAAKEIKRLKKGE